MTVLLLRRMNTAESYFEVLYEGEGRNIIMDVTLRLDTLIMQPVSISNTTEQGNLLLLQATAPGTSMPL
jgi:hypothetical protein